MNVNATRNYNLTAVVWKVQNMSEKEIYQDLVNRFYCPIVCGNEFTVVPHAPDEGWGIIKSTYEVKDKERARLFGPDGNAEILTHLRNKMRANCNWVAPFMTVHLNRIKQVSTGKAIELGCGTGAHSDVLLKKGWRVLAIDILPEMVEHTRKIFANNQNFSVVQADIAQYPLAKNSVDLIVAVDVLTELQPGELLPLISKIYDALVPGGIFLGSLNCLASQERREEAESVCLMGGTVYVGENIVSRLLKSRGFSHVKSRGERHQAFGEVLEARQNFCAMKS